MLESAEALPTEAEEARNRAEGEFDALDLMAKGKAVMATAYNIKLLARIPAYFKKTLEDLKADLQEVKDAVD